eukprot:TRINITY_DN5428_c0_g1_i1.p2 TRINITY_DN5428_c0_g1~~TRINITY_DN5428_c0_g1_i1.p2  ORF type:complete len:151 (+),score=50.57 TRINITY_DN5428_c0_g1_i1:51-503(+)
MKVETCSFSGLKIHPGHGSVLIKLDARLFRFRTHKDKAYFLQKQKAAKFNWTVVYRRVNKKNVSEALSRRRKRNAKKSQRAVVGMDLTLVNKIKTESKKQRSARQQAAVKELRERRAKARAAQKSRPKQTQAAKGRGQKAKGGVGQTKGR